MRTEKSLKAGMRFIAGARRLILCAVAFTAMLSAGVRADTPNPEWVLVFKDEFSASSFEGKKTGSFTPEGFTHWPFDRDVEFYLLIDQQIGGNWPGQANPAELKAKSANFDIDYVRVYSTPEYKFSPIKKKQSKQAPTKTKVKRTGKSTAAKKEKGDFPL